MHGFFIRRTRDGLPSNGAAELARIGARLKAEGDGLLKARTQRALRSSAEPLKPLVRAAAMRKLPSRGGLNRYIAGQRISVVTRLVGANAGVRLRTAGTQTDKGVVRQPTFGREPWVTQQIPQAAGWWSDTLRQSSPIVVPALTRVMAQTAAEVEGR